MKKQIWEISKKTVREDVVREVATQIHALAVGGVSFQLTISNKPPNSNLNNIRRAERGYCKQIAEYAISKGADTDANKIHDFNKLKFLTPILCHEDAIFREAYKAATATAEHSKIGKKTYLIEWCRIFARLELISSNEILDNLLSSIQKFYQEKYNLKLGD